MTVTDYTGSVAKPEFVANRDGQTVAEAVNGFVSSAARGLVGGIRLDIATAYFNLGGYQLLADSLDQAHSVRLLIGAEPHRSETRPRRLANESADPERAVQDRLRTALEQHQQGLTAERDLLGFAREIDSDTRRLVKWLRSEEVEVRRLADNFLHGKAFLVADQARGVIAGSSNFTRAGLAHNVELNLGNYTPHVVKQVNEWFDELWTEAKEFDLAALYEARFEPHSPYLIYLRMLWERYRDELEDEAEEDGLEIQLAGFQTHGVWRAKRILAKRNGVLIADEVGLGKTFLAGALIKEAALDNRQRVLVVAPATLKDGPWRAFRSQFMLPMELVSYEDLWLDRRLHPNATDIRLDADPNEYAMVVVDEAHNLRNPGTKRSEALRRLLQGSPPKKLVLLTATPVNNSLMDLYHQLGFFLRNDAAFADEGIPSMRNHFAQAMAKKPEDLSPEHLFDVLDAVAVRRTRSFVRRYYPNSRVPIRGKETDIIFPTPKVRRVTYRFDQVLPGFFEEFAWALDPDSDLDASPIDSESVKPLTLARYAPSQYRLKQDIETHEVQLAGLLRSGLLKRFESSPYAFARTCEGMAAKHDDFLELLDHGKVATGEALADWIATDSDDVDSYLEEHEDRIDDAEEYDLDRLRRHAAQDRETLLYFARRAREVTRDKDPNLAVLVEELAKIAQEAKSHGIGPEDARNRRKVLIFSYYADTVDWIVKHLKARAETDPRLADYRGRIASLSGSTGVPNKREVVWGFAPKTADAPAGEDEDRYDIVVSTDVLAEGVNLQQAGQIINYDLPWNPMRLVQRHGRIDRIGSYHSQVVIRCVFPNQKLDDLLQLEERLNRKIGQAAAAVGVGEVLPGQERREVVFSETREEIENLRKEDSTLFEQGGSRRGTISGEEYRQALRQAVDQGLREQIEQLPWGSGSGMALTSTEAAEPGYVFCLRVADSEKPLFRYVGPDDGGTPIADTLACLDRARPLAGADTPLVDMDDETYGGAFDAWDVARTDVVEKWNFQADPLNLAPEIRPALTKAAQIVRKHHPPDLAQDEIDSAIDTIQAPYPERTIRTISAAWRKSEDPKEQAANILAVIKDLGLERYQPPRPLPQITEEDVHLICWIALIPEKQPNRPDNEDRQRKETTDEN